MHFSFIFWGFVRSFFLNDWSWAYFTQSVQCTQNVNKAWNLTLKCYVKSRSSAENHWWCCNTKLDSQPMCVALHSDLSLSVFCKMHLVIFMLITEFVLKLQEIFRDRRLWEFYYYSLVFTSIFLRQSWFRFYQSKYA